MSFVETMVNVTITILHIILNAIALPSLGFVAFPPPW